MHTGGLLKQHNSQAFLSGSISSINPTLKTSSRNNLQKQHQSRIAPRVSKISMDAEITSVDCNLEAVVPKKAYKNHIAIIRESKLENLEKSFALSTKKAVITKTPKEKTYKRLSEKL